MGKRKKVAFYTLGCKLNFSETSTIARNFKDEGFDRVDFEEVADMYVINTCSVTENADKQFSLPLRLVFGFSFFRQQQSLWKNYIHIQTLF